MNPDWMRKDGGSGFDDGVDYEDDIVHEATDNVDYNFWEWKLLLAGNPVQSSRLIKYRTKVASKYQIDWNFPSLQVNTGVTGSNLLQGKILNLLIDCNAPLPIVGSQRVHFEVCVTLKLQGTESCKFNNFPFNYNLILMCTFKQG